MTIYYDKQGFYKTRDAVKFVDPADPKRGMIFDGRIAEDFKLDTGTVEVLYRNTLAEAVFEFQEFD